MLPWASASSIPAFAGLLRSGFSAGRGRGDEEAGPAGRPALFLELLHGALARDGYLSPGATQEIAEALEASPADVYSAATFYHYVPTQPDPTLPVGVCEGPVCRLTCPQADRLLRRWAV